jgi:hypothetical protein
MVTRAQSLQQYMLLNQRETIQRVVGSVGGKPGLPVATNDIRRTALSFHGEILKVGRYSADDAAIIIPAIGLPKLFIAPERTDYLKIFLAAFKDLKISIPPGSSHIDVDHALAKSLATGRFQYVLMNPVSRGPNRTFGSFEKGSKHRIFNNGEMELASITEALKICEIAPVKRGNLAEDCLIGVINARESGLIDRNEIKPILYTITNSSNNLVSEAYSEVQPEFDEEAAKIIQRG